MYDEYLEIHSGNLDKESISLIGSVIYSEKENPYICTHYKKTLDDYVKCGIHKIFHISLEEYERLPIWKMEMMNNISIEKLNELSKNMDKISSELTTDLGDLE